MRAEQRVFVDHWHGQHPNEHLVLTKDEYDFIFATDADFEAKYGNRQRHTQKYFDEFVRTMKDHFEQSAIRDLPYIVRLDSQPFYLPTKAEREQFFQWIEEEVRAIAGGKPGRTWHLAQPGVGYANYGAFYTIHRAQYPHDQTVSYQLSVMGPRSDSSGLEVIGFGYGGLNLDALTSEVEKAVKQLEASARRSNEPALPRVIVVRFEGGLDPDDWAQVELCVNELLKAHTSVSAIAVLEWGFDGPAPAPAADLAEILAACLTARPVPRFIVYHNQWLRDIEPLPQEAFADASPSCG